MADERIEVWPSIIADAVMHYWLNGCEDEELRAWWQTDEAAACAVELGHAIHTAINIELGYPLAAAVAPRFATTPHPQSDCKRCGMPWGSHTPDGYCYTDGDDKFLEVGNP